MKCPGQDSRYWKPSSIFESECPNCGKPVEFFKDDPTRRCDHCGHKFVNPGMDFGCAAYCKFADQCIGSLPPEVMAQRQNLMKDRIAVEMKKHFKTDFKRIGHATRVARHAEAIAGREGGDLAVILAAAYLHDTGIHEDITSIARRMMETIGANAQLIDAVCTIIDLRHRPKPEETVNFKVFHDADRIAGIEDEMKEHDINRTDLEALIENRFLTDAGRKRAAELFLT